MILNFYTELEFKFYFFVSYTGISWIDDAWAEILESFLYFFYIPSALFSSHGKTPSILANNAPRTSAGTRNSIDQISLEINW